MTQHSIGIIGFSHVCIAVSNMEVSLPFYRDVLGLGVACVAFQDAEIPVMSHAYAALKSGDVSFDEMD